VSDESILTQPNNLGDNEFEEFGLLGNSKPQDISNIETDQDKDLQKKPVKVVDSVAELEQLLNGIAVEKGKKWSATRTKLDESDMQTSASSLENIEFSIPPPPPPLSPSSLSMQHPRNHTVLSSQRGGRLNFPLTSSDRTPEDGETPKHNDNAPNWKLKLPKRFEKGVIPIHDVCIEPHPKPWIETKAGSCPHRPDKKYNINRRIVIYNSPFTKTTKELSVGGHGNRKNVWEVFYQTGPPPSKYKYAPYPALFVTTSCEANLHHFLVDQFSRIFGVMKDVKRLGGSNEQEFEKQKVALFYRDDVHDFCRDTGCHDPTKFEELLYTLPIRSHRAYFTDDAHLGVCFKDAVIGTHRMGVKDKDVSNLIVQGLSNKMKWEKQKQNDNHHNEEDEEEGQGGEDGHKSKHKHHHGKDTNEVDALTSTCPSDPDKTVLILQRQNRKLLNVEELSKIVKTYSKGKLYVNIVEFEDASVLQQIITVRCCKLFIAVMGAGQQWVSFMRSGTTLLSIGWSNWNANYYSKYAKENNVKFIPVITNDVTPNFNDPTIIKFFGADKLKSQSYRNELLRSGNKQIAKYSDVRLPEKDMMNVLRSTFKI